MHYDPSKCMKIQTAEQEVIPAGLVVSGMVRGGVDYGGSF